MFIAQILVETGVVQVNTETPFTWTSGIKSPIYCDCRDLISLPGARQQIVNAWLEVIETFPVKPEAIAGTATAGIPWAAWVADALGLPLLYVRSKPKGHGAGKMVEGRLGQGKRVLVVEDAISTAGSAVQSVQALRQELNAIVTDVLAVFSWSLPISKKHATEANIQLRPLTHFTEILETLTHTDAITETQAQQVADFHQTLT